MMGFGGVTALGCTIGQGLTGISTLAVGSILAFGADHRGMRGGGALPDVAAGEDGVVAATGIGVNRIMIVFDLRLRARPCLRGLVRLGRGIRRASRTRISCAAPSATTRASSGSRRRACACARAARRSMRRRPTAAAGEQSPASRPSSSPSCARSCATPKTSANASPRRRARSTTRKSQKRSIRGKASREDAEALTRGGHRVLAAAADPHRRHALAAASPAGPRWAGTL